MFHFLEREGVLMKSKGYHSWIHKFGILSSLFLFAAMTAFPIAASVIYGAWPDFKQLWPGFVAVILFMAPYWPLYVLHYRKCYES